MKAAYLCTNPGAISYVYGEKQHEMVEMRVELLPGIFTSVHDERLKDVEAVFSTWGMPVCTEEEIREYMPKLRYVFYAAGTVQNFARPFLNCGIRVFSAWQANAVPVVEFAHAQIMLALKGYFQTRQAMKHGRHEGRSVFENYPGVFDVKVGLLGCGAIGSRVAEKLKVSDVEVLVFDPFLSDERANALNVRKTDLDEIFAECDVVSNHLANLPETVGIIRREHLMSMKPYSTFINTGRGPQLDEKDLYDMLTADKTRFALLDVMTDEENSDTKPLNSLDNCWITPHIAGSSGYEVRRMAEYMIEAWEKVTTGQACSYEVTEKMLETMA